MDCKLAPLKQNEEPLFYRLDGERAERHGAIGYLRVDFGRNGNEFWSTWFDTQKYLKTQGFKDSFVIVMNYLSPEIFKNRSSMRTFCAGEQGLSFGERGKGFKLETVGYTYYLRCNPGRADYDAYVFAYDNRYLLPELAGQYELPVDCHSVLPSNGDLILIVRGKDGYFPSSNSTTFPDINRKIADENNAHFGVTRSQEEAMLAGSLFGWDVPAAKPWRYELDGTPRVPPPKNKENHER